MKLKVFIYLTVVTFVAIAGTWLYAQQHQPAGSRPASPSPGSPPSNAQAPLSLATPRSTAQSILCTPALNPSVIPLNIATLITAQCKITDPTLISTSVNLLRLGAGGSTSVLGQLHDDGRNGDQVAGDGVYTITLNFNATTVAEVDLQVSAAFQGKVKRVLSPIIPLGVLNFSAPPNFAINSQLLTAGGPVSLNNFANQYDSGGIIPPGGAEMEITSLPLPPPPLSDFIANNLYGTNVTSSSSVLLAGISCTEDTYTYALGPVLTYNNIGVYCPSGNSLYTIYLSYRLNDPMGNQFITSFQALLNAVQFP
jgi:hypothetical protein